MKLKLLFNFGLLLCLLLPVHNVLGQSQPNQSGFYLLDSLDLTSLSDKDKLLIDSTLVNYHASENDTDKLNLLNHIINNCLDDDVWPGYNQYMKVSSQNLFIPANGLESKWNIKVVNMLALAINNEGYLLYYQGNIDGALLKYHESLNLREKTGDQLGISEIYNNIGGIYYIQEEYDKSVDYFKRSLSIKKKLHTPISYATSLNNIGGIYNIIGDLDSAEYYYNMGLEIYEAEKDQEGIGLCYHNLASIYSKKKNHELARLFFLKSIRIHEGIGEYRMVSNSYALLGKMYLELDQLADAELFSNRALNYAEELGYPDEIKEATNILHQLYRKKGNYKMALDMYDQYVLMKDSILNSKIKQEIANAELTYEFEKKTLADSLKHVEENRINEHKIKQQNARLKRERIITFALVLGVILLIIITVLIWISLRNKRKANVEIERQRDLVQQQHEITENQRLILESQNKEILDSITYAKRLQEAILPSPIIREMYLPDSFVLYKPKDIVAGDFYWIKEIGDITYFAVADCTGHGVPGAFVSLVCSNALNNVILEIGAVSPNEILDRATEHVIQAFEQSSHQIKDGMDIGLCAFNKTNNCLEFSGAYNPLWIISNRKSIENIEARVSENEENGPFLHEVKGTRRPVGKYAFDTPFSLHKIYLEPGEVVYLISDGYADQFGGESGKKFKYKQLKSLLLGISHYPLNDQHQMLSSAFEDWKGVLEQVDDVCVMGVIPLPKA